MTEQRSLDDVRREIDRIDDTIQDLIIERTALVEAVRDLKRDSPIKIRPAREAEIVYRLIGRHRGPFPKPELVAIWRQLITATLAFEGPFSVAVLTPEDARGYWDLARDHFGHFVPMTRHASVRSVIEAVHRQDATVGVLPMVRTDDDDPWWRHVVTNKADAPRIIARLPFAGRSNGVGGDLEALVVAPVTMTPSGRDRSLFALDLEPGIGLNALKAILAETGLAPTLAAQWADAQDAGPCLYLAEIDGFLTADDPRLAHLKERIGTALKRCVLLGGYAVPLSAEELSAPPRPRRRGRASSAATAGTPAA